MLRPLPQTSRSYVRKRSMAPHRNGPFLHVVSTFRIFRTSRHYLVDSLDFHLHRSSSFVSRFQFPIGLCCRSRLWIPFLFPFLRVQLATNEWIPSTSVLEGVVILTRNPELDDPPSGSTATAAATPGKEESKGAQD